MESPKLPPLPPAAYDVMDDYYEGWVLIPQPEDRFKDVSLYTAEQMTAYALEAVRQDRAVLEAQPKREVK